MGSRSGLLTATLPITSPLASTSLLPFFLFSLYLLIFVSFSFFPSDNLTCRCSGAHRRPRHCGHLSPLHPSHWGRLSLSLSRTHSHSRLSLAIIWICFNFFLFLSLCIETHPLDIGSGNQNDQDKLWIIRRNCFSHFRKCQSAHWKPLGGGERRVSLPSERNSFSLLFCSSSVLFSGFSWWCPTSIMRDGLLCARLLAVSVRWLKSASSGPSRCVFTQTLSLSSFHRPTWIPT